MIELTKLNDVPFVLNSDLIETIEETPDTTIRLINKNYYIVKESAHEIKQRVIRFKKNCSGFSW
ncbi:flagellar FlbD family protein [Scatolibacter rhodanostii]|uniref:flagellar FlbD family protein n=1 Tax=Scatolibacter rhodanostii TaxID=2014781 RepID=UPI000C06F0E9|nr:flagellar FlbD family protein [Scatolibacter rhodanostii]